MIRHALKYSLFFPLAVLAVSCGSKTTRPDGTPKESSIQLDSTSAHLGTFPRSASNKATVFTFTNVGDAPLVFEYTDVSCNCVTAVFPEKPVKPGKKGEIRVYYKGQGKRPGKVYQKVYAKTNGTPSILTLRIHGQMTEK